MDNNIGNARRAYAKRVGKYTQEDAARDFSVSLSAYRNWEQGKNLPNAGVANTIAKKYGVTVDYLLGNTQENGRYAITAEYDDSLSYVRAWAHVLPLSQDEEELLNCYRQVEPWERELILNHAKMVVLHAGKDRR